MKLYWQIGRSITGKQAQASWGKAVVEQLASDLQQSFSGRSGFSDQNLWYMRQFYLEYKELPNLRQLVGEVSWGQNLTIMAKVKDPDERECYLKAIAEQAWSVMS